MPDWAGLNLGQIPHCTEQNSSQMPGWGNAGCGFGIDWYNLPTTNNDKRTFVACCVACVQTFPLLHAEKGRLRNAVANRVPFPRATKEIGDVCTQATCCVLTFALVTSLNLFESFTVSKLKRNNSNHEGLIFF